MNNGVLIPVVGRRSLLHDGCSPRSLRSISRWVIVWSLPFFLFAAPLFVSVGNGSEIPEWPHEQQERLRAVESEILNVQRKLFVARVNNDEQNRVELEKQMKELEREQVKLLRATGQFPPR
jgi:hypothetical protein